MGKGSNLQELKAILIKASNQGVDVIDLLRKVDNAIGNANSKTIKIVLMGAFSDGKTTVVAGLTGHLEDDMKIAIDESSDELTFYHLPALGYNFEFVDTPGLFGSKEKEIDGRFVRFSDITREYLSQAHIVIYVTDAVNPLKDSHVPILKFTLKDLNKLPSTIFVINKMDEAGYELNDEEDFNRGETIKKKTFIDNLQRNIKLSPNEVADLKVVCIAANPNGRGLERHFLNMENYLKKSRINNLRKVVINTANSSDQDSLRENVDRGTLRDLVSQAINKFQNFIAVNGAKIDELQSLYDDTSEKLARIRSVAIENMGLLKTELKNTQEAIELDILNVSKDEFSIVVNKHFGKEGERLEATINQIFSKYAEMNNAEFQKTNIQGSFDKMSELTKSLISATANLLKNTKIGADTVKSVRDVVASGFKFKPWGAVKLGAKLTRVISIASLFIEAFLWWKDYKENKKFQEAKDNLLKCTQDAFNSAETDYLKNENTYIKNFAPGILDVQKALHDTQENLDNLRRFRDVVKELRNTLRKWIEITSNDGNSY